MSSIFSATLEHIFKLNVTMLQYHLHEKTPIGDLVAIILYITKLMTLLIGVCQESCTLVLPY